MIGWPATFIKEQGPTKEMLMTRAQDLDIDARSDMTKDELVQALIDD